MKKTITLNVTGEEWDFWEIRGSYPDFTTGSSREIPGGIIGTGYGIISQTTDGGRTYLLRRAATSYVIYVIIRKLKKMASRQALK